MSNDVPEGSAAPDRDPAPGPVSGDAADVRPGPVDHPASHPAPSTSAVDPAPTQLIPRVDVDELRTRGGPGIPESSILLTPPTVPAHKVRGSREARRRRVAKRVVATVATLLVVALVGGFFLLRHLNGNIRQIDIRAALGGGRTSPAVDVGDHAPMNILLMGSDTRAGLGTQKYGDAKDIVGARSDVTMIAHLAADRQSAVVVSIPRDTMVKAPEKCDLEAPESAWVVKQFNANFEEGGAPCTVKVVEEMTGLYIDHVATVDFNGFKDMVDAIGTVPVCLTAPVKDSDSGANFPAGRQRLNGEQALSFVRLRHAGDGSDTSRIKRQQDFLSSMIREALSAQLLKSPTRTYQFLDAATSSLTTDPGIASVQALGSIANSLHNITPGNIRFVSMPWEAYPQDPNRIQPAPAAKKVWEVLRTDAPWPGTPDATASATPSTPTPTPTPPAPVPPATVALDVVNASGKEGLGKQAAAALTAQGFVVRTTTNATATVDGVVIHYAPADKAKAQELGAAFTNPVYTANGVPGQAIRLEIGLGASKVRLVPNAPATAKLPAQPMNAPPTKTTIETKTASQDLCSDTSTG